MERVPPIITIFRVVKVICRQSTKKGVFRTKVQDSCWRSLDFGFYYYLGLVFEGAAPDWQGLSDSSVFFFFVWLGLSPAVSSFYMTSD